MDASGRELFIVAGEANDTLTIFDDAGLLVGQIAITAADVPANFPRDGSWGPWFRPDSVTSFAWGSHTYVAASLKASGAVGVWQMSDPERVRFVQAVKVGRSEAAGSDAESSVGTEGISASSEHGFIVTANEGESSVSLVLPEP